jgi:hypothetical protein
MPSKARRCSLLAAVALVGSAIFQAPGALAADKAATFRTATWEELVPKDWDPLKQFRDKNIASIPEGSARELALMREIRDIWDNAPTRSDLNGAKLRLPGFVVPLEQSRREIKEFLLVPYFGACIHSPPPPANQIVYVVLATPRPLRTMDTVWVSGTMKTTRQDSPWGTSGYSMEGLAVEPYRAPPR